LYRCPTKLAAVYRIALRRLFSAFTFLVRWILFPRSLWISGSGGLFAP